MGLRIEIYYPQCSTCKNRARCYLKTIDEVRYGGCPYTELPKPPLHFNCSCITKVIQSLSKSTLRNMVESKVIRRV